MSEIQSEIEASLGVGDTKHHLKTWLLWIGVAVVLGAIGWWWMQDAEERAKVTYITEKVSQGDLTVTVTATGAIEPTNQVEISSELSGTIAEVLVDYNDTVTAGQVLARMDTVQLDAQLAVQEANHAAADAQLANARASLVEAEANYDIARQLDERGVTSRTNLTVSEAALGRALANVASAQANVDLAQAQLEAQIAVLSKATIISPINGIVLDRTVDAGQIVAASLSAPKLFTIAEDLAQMELQVDVAEADIGRINVDDKAIFTVDAYDDHPFPAQISMVRYAPDSTDGLVTYKAILSVENDNLLLRPGMTATADISVAQYNDVLLVPNAALRFAPPQVVEVEASDKNSGGGGLLGLIMPSRPADSTRAGSDSTLWVLRNDIPVEIEVEKGDSDGLQTIVAGGDLVDGDQVITDMIEGR
ncbi:Macrolide-specific efflux protein MacA precursor [Thalassovita gelatinovora]|uniref:Macrolide-specific efflux protein MacA n=1 Tax=Thalassovita gelatinovora TaxID=53501 RepID=A0A0P1G860_THAGE|nr:efflux RND transporter periplasmic adaptor subunit [Thalassovita gelatinovora]QIZ82171.1 efflux RND transporter periplasmic adaptor subunit [Thalassovita gelatinovora]CUH67783.1 Macrolide-specific efflux protein MacA precursor [Thalassovita gelatinovora]SEP67484.1 HlyD family secretion protein [Thalassovita gelatinovora]